MNTLWKWLFPEEGRLSDAPFQQMRELQTPRLLLRKARMGDAADIYAYAKDPEVARHVLWEAEKSLAEAKGYVRYLRGQYRAGAPSSYVLQLKATGQVIGTMGYMSYDPETRTAEVGYSLAQAWWNQGLATEALTALLHYAFGTLGLHRVEALYEVDNPASGRVMEKCGMKKEGCLRQRVKNKGRYVDVYLCAVLADEWKIFTSAE